MTLKEKFKEEKLYINPYSFKLTEDSAVRFEQIADDYAIEFAEWLYKWDNTRLPNGNWIIGLGLKPLTSKEALEIYKKEKGL